MKKLKLLLSVSILFFALYSCDQQSEIDSLESSESIENKKPVTKSFETLTNDSNIDYCGQPVECPLIAGQHIDAGTVTIKNDENYLYVKVYSKAGFQNVDENIKMWIGTEPPSKRPPAGHFPYKVTESGDTHIFQIELSSIDAWSGDCGENTQPLIIIVHADVLTEVGNANSGETAFGGCQEGAGKAWWYYMEYSVQCCEEEECMDAFGVKHDNIQSSCINDIWASWLWGSWISGTGVYDGIILYLDDDDNCDNSDNEVIGHIEISISTMDSKQLKIKYVIDKEGYKLSEVDFSIKERGIDADYRNFNESVDMKSDHTLYIPWSGNIEYNAQLVYFIEKAKVCYTME